MFAPEKTNIITCPSCSSSFTSCIPEECEKLLQDHHKKNNLCRKWTSEINTNGICKFIQEIVHIINEPEPFCYGCNMTYSNIGNLNKHFKNHNECLKFHLLNKLIKKHGQSFGQIIRDSEGPEEDTVKPLYNNICGFNNDLLIKHFTRCSRSNQIGIIDHKEYYKGYPFTGHYFDDLNWAKEESLKILKKLVIEETSGTVICDFDDTLVLGDIVNVLGIKEMEYGKNKDGNDIFVLPPIQQIVDVITYAKEHGFSVYIISSRPISSFDATIFNLNLFKIPCDIVIHCEGYKTKPEEIVSRGLNVVLSIGDQPTDCFLPNAVRLPSPDCMMAFST